MVRINPNLIYQDKSDFRILRLRNEKMLIGDNIKI